MFFSIKRLKKSRKTWIQVLTVTASLLPFTSTATTDWISQSLKFIESTVLPAHQQFVAATEKLQAASAAYCQSEPDTSKGALINTFHLAADAWHGMQIYRAGPAQAFMRHGRIETWPGIANITNRQMRQLLNNQDKAALEPERFASSSAAIQGFPALERIIFGSETSPSPLQPGTFACKVVNTITQNLHRMSLELVTGWRGEHRHQIERAGQTDSYLSSGEDVAGELLTDLYQQLYSMVDQKLERPYIKDQFRHKRTESWRSQRSIRNIKFNLRASEDFYRALFLPAIENTPLNDTILALFNDANLIGEQLNDHFASAEAEQGQEIKQWHQTLGKIRDLVQFELPGALKITIGFNALDGDG